MYSIEEYTRYKYFVDNIKDIVWEMDAKFIFTFVSASTKEIIGYEVDEVVGKCMLDFLTSESRQHVIEQWQQRLHNRSILKKVLRYDVQFVCKDRRVIWFEVSVKPVIKGENVLGYIGVSRDISEKKMYENELKKYIEELKNANIKLDKLATFDMLTDAYNRRKFEYFVTLCIEDKEKYGHPFSIIMFDIDHFKRINDTFGHKTGDRILKELTKKVKDTIKETNKVFRWGGEEFIILLPETSLNSTYNAAEKVRQSIQSNDFGIENHSITISSGAGEYTDLENIDQFIARVDEALLSAKSNGRNKVELSACR